MIRFWIRQNAQDTTLPEDLVQATWLWLTTAWQFSQHFFRINQAEVRSRQALESSGLSEQFAVFPATQPTGYLLFAIAN